MAKPPEKPKPEDIETEPGAWERFEHAVDAAVKSGPKHRVAPKSRVPLPPKGTVHDFRTFDHALSDKEVSALFAGTSSI